MIGIAVFASSNFIENPLMAPILLLLNAFLFWGIYHLWKYVGDKNQEDS